MKHSNRFRHESLQSPDSIKGLLKALTNGIGKGKVVLEDDNGNMILEPEGLLHLKISANQDDDRNRINIKISWQGENNIPKKKDLKITDK
ncbi:amphi-Trp domain-containing protein [Terasakiella sp. A23]|uniref:amphi-Trp domain-containing protein n=1 Tax=Terasakiella sp. FCG-A23 TaxID=3080561 RepID=UPI0029555220|nr:amphi-Trp domain-containing protein [Terasakiella sp. A23]MDV7338236.1 amphi-Trp domain-containing protein [Terasakiella sp. A23]